MLLTPLNWTFRNVYDAKFNVMWLYPQSEIKSKIFRRHVCLPNHRTQLLRLVEALWPWVRELPAKLRNLWGLSHDPRLWIFCVSVFCVTACTFLFAPTSTSLPTKPPATARQLFLTCRSSQNHCCSPAAGQRPARQGAPRSRWMGCKWPDLWLVKISEN